MSYIHTEIPASTAGLCIAATAKSIESSSVAS